MGSEAATRPPLSAKDEVVLRFDAIGRGDLGRLGGTGVRVAAGPFAPRVPHEGRVREVDVFAGAAEGLVLAEVEFTA
ncbi:hypothetical protein [Sphingobium indicum]|nr:hypothetical protein [Sphingobium indicum]